MTVVLLHPIGLDAASWQFLEAAELRDAVRHTMLLHGDRETPSREPAIADYAADVVEQVPGLLDVIGLSMGGAVALQIATRYPERVRSLAVIAATSGGGDPHVYLDRAAAAEQGGMASVIESTLERWFTSGALASRNHPGVRYARERLLADDASRFATSWRALAGHDVTRSLSTLAVPVSVIHPRDDASVPESVATELAATLPRGRFDSIEGPHMVQLEEPVALRDALARHLTWVDTELPAR